MSRTPATMPNLLRRSVRSIVSLDTLNGDKVKAILRSYIGSAAAQKMRVDEARRELKKLLADTDRKRKVVDDLPEPQRQVLAICRRYGGAVTGALLLAETKAHGLISPKEEPSGHHYERNKSDPVLSLCQQMLLMSWDGHYLDYYGYGYASYYGHGFRYPDVALAPGVADAIEPAALLPWSTSPSAPPASVQLRSTAEVALDLSTIAQVLHESGSWKTNKGGAVSKSLQNRLRKALAPPEDDPLTPPDVEALYYELLRGLDAVEIADNEGRLDPAAVQRHLDRPAVQQCWRLVQAWMHIRLWQDGIGIVPDRDSDYDPVRIHPDLLEDARELVVWALQRIAHGSNDWFDLSAFLVEFQEQTHSGADFYWSNYSWVPKLKTGARPNQRNEHQARSLSYWLKQEGTWIANAVLGTLGYLGLVERGDVDSQPNFRLTPLGQAVFAAPEAAPLPETSPRFLAVQPNHEIVAYLNAADAAAVWPLARMARRTTTTAGLVQTFVLTRDSVYQALESGLTLEQMQTFLREHSTTGLPDNVAVSLTEWGRKREALTLRTGVSLLLAPSEPATILSKAASAGKKAEVVVKHNQAPVVCWSVDEDGRIAVDAKADAVALARLSQFADASERAWRITAGSARRAHKHGIRAEQVLAWLTQHARTEVPPLLETMIRTWTDGGGVFLGELLLLQVPQEQACTVLREHRQFQAFYLAHLPPNWFIVRPEKRGELERLLQEMGFATNIAWKPAPTKKAEAEKEPRRKKRRRPYE